MNTLSKDRWNALWTSVAEKGDANKWFDALCVCYDEPHRHYHTFRHVSECLEAFDPVRTQAIQPAAVELAIWFHDAVYDTHAADNEDRSAALAAECLEEAGAGASLSASVRDLVLATKTHDPGSVADAGLMLDIDLSILGQPVNRFMEYESQIRAEYAWVPQERFSSGRAEILERFLSRERIYVTDWFFRAYEQQARLNLQASLQRLRKSSPSS